MRRKKVINMDIFLIIFFPILAEPRPPENRKWGISPSTETPWLNEVYNHKFKIIPAYKIPRVSRSMPCSRNYDHGENHGVLKGVFWPK